MEPIAIKDEGRATRELSPKPKKKRKPSSSPAPVSGEQAYATPKTPRRSPVERPPWDTDPTGRGEPVTFESSIDPYGAFDPFDKVRNAVYDLLNSRQRTKEVKDAQVPEGTIYPVSPTTSAPTVAGGKFVEMRGGKLQETAPFTVDKEALRAMRQVWNVVGPKYFPGQAMPIPTFIHRKDAKVEAAAWVTTTPEGYKLVYWPRDLAKRLAEGDSMTVSTLLHEWAHVFQRGYAQRDETEGGATAFETAVHPVVVQELGFDDIPFSHGSAQYEAFARQVRQEGGRDFVLWGQFGGKRPRPVMGEQATGGSKAPPRTPIRAERDKVPTRQRYAGGVVQTKAPILNATSIFDLNRRAEIANAAFASQFGYEPSPGLLLNVLQAMDTGIAREDELEDLFKVPASFQRARAMAAAQEEYLHPSQEELQRTREDLERRARAGTISLEDYQTELKDLDARINAAGIESFGDLAPVEKYVLKPAIIAPAQIIESFVYAPVGAGILSANVSLDIWDVLRGDDATFKRSREMGKAIAKSTAESYKAPLDNPGYILLDAFGALSGGAGAVSRVGAAGKASAAARAARTGAVLPFSIENLRPQTLARVGKGQVGLSVLSALIHRPNPGTFALGPPGAQEHVLLSENALRRVTQRAWLSRVQRQLIRNLEADPGLRIEAKSHLTRWRQSVLSPEKKLGRAAMARWRVEKEVGMGAVHLLERTQVSTLNAASIYSRLPFLSRTKKAQAYKVTGADAAGLSVGEQMAVLFASTPAHDPVGYWRNWHVKMLEWGLGDAEAHRAKLAAVELGAAVWNNPSRRMRKVFATAQRVSDEQELMKIAALGLDPVKAAQRRAKERDVLHAAFESSGKSEFLARLDEVIEGDPMPDVIAGSVHNYDIPGFYYPSKRRKDAVTLPGDEVIGFNRSSSKYGTPKPNISRIVPELSHRFTARALVAGDTVVNVNHLIGDAYRRVFRAISVVEDYKRLLALSVDKPNAAIKQQRGFLRPIRTLDGVSDELKEFLAPFFEDRMLTDGESRKLAESKQLDDLHGFLFPEAKDVEGLEGVRWVDERVMGDLHRDPTVSAVRSGWVLTQEPVKAAAIYLKPSYALNLLSNAGMAVFSQGPLMPVYMLKSLRAAKDIGEENVAKIDAVTGGGKALSFTSQDIVTAKLSRSLANFWNRFIDQWQRRSDYIYWAERKGYKTKEDFDRLLDPKATDEKVLRDRAEIGQRAKKDMVEFDNLSWFEKQAIRDFVYVYPWVRGAAIWSVRTALEHPLKTWSAVALAREGEKYVKETLADAQGYEQARVPDWFLDSGYFPVAIDEEDGQPWILNANQLNTFSTLSELLQTGEGAFSDDPTTSLMDILGPFPELAIRAVTGRNSFGTKYEHGTLGAVADFFAGESTALPQVRALLRARQAEPELDDEGKPESIDQSSGERPGGVLLPTSTGQSVRADRRPTFFTSAEAAYGPLISGGLWPRKADLEALESDYWRDESTAARKAQRAKVYLQMRRQGIRDEVRQLVAAEEITSNIIGRKAPKEVKGFIRWQEKFQYVYVDFAGKAGRMPTAAEQSDLRITALTREGRITQDRAKELRKELSKAIKQDDLGSFNRSFGDEFLNRQEMLAWHKERDTILEFANNAKAQLKYLSRQGLFANTLGAKLKDEELWSVGRSVYAYEDKLKARPSAEASYVEGFRGAQNRLWLESQDNPINVNGKKFPSPVRLKWAADTLRGTIDDPFYEQKKLAALTAHGWDTLTSFEKELAGKPVEDDVSRGWMVFEAVTGAMRGNVTGEEAQGVRVKAVDGSTINLVEYLPEALPQGERSLEKADRLALAKWVSKYFSPNFYKDYLYSIQPKYERVRILPAITKSENKEEWSELLQTAQGQFAYIKYAREQRAAGNYKLGYTISSVQDAWKDYASRTLLPYYESEDPEFLQELAYFGGEDFLRSLIDD